MPLKNAEVISILNELIETCENGMEGFKSASEAIDDPVAKALFASRIPNIQRGESELKAEVRRLGGEPEKRGTVAGAVHRAWIDLKSAVTGKNQEAIVMECERGEEHAAHSYEDALQKDLPLDTRAMIERQYRGVVENLNRVRALSKEPSAASVDSAAVPPRMTESESRPSA